MLKTFLLSIGQNFNFTAATKLLDKMALKQSRIKLLEARFRNKSVGPSKPNL